MCRVYVWSMGARDFFRRRPGVRATLGVIGDRRRAPDRASDLGDILRGMICALTGNAHRLFWMRSAWWCHDCRQKIEACCDGGGCPSVVDASPAGDAQLPHGGSGFVPRTRSRAPRMVARASQAGPGAEGGDQQQRQGGVVVYGASDGRWR
jgi:hypothetical protein